jgi:hypothetical protein
LDHLPSGTFAIVLVLFFPAGEFLCSAQLGSSQYRTEQSPDKAVKAAYLAYFAGMERQGLHRSEGPARQK